MNWGGIRPSALDRPPNGGTSALDRLGHLFDRTLIELRRFRLFLRMASQIVHSVRPGTAQSSGETAARYQKVVNAIDLPDRAMPLTEFERVVEGEASLIGQMARIAAESVVTNHCAMRKRNVFSCAMRDQHAKSHGCVRAEFIVREDLPEEFSTSLFRAGARYPAIVRFSNGNGKSVSDRRIDARGMSIKLLHVEGPTVLRSIAPDKTPCGEHDFLFSSYPVFFCKNVVDYSRLIHAVVAPLDTWPERFAAGLLWIGFVVRYPRQFFTFIRTGLILIDDPLTATYHSMSPYLFGRDKVVRYRVGPAEPARKAYWFSRILSWLRSKNFLGEALVRDLDPAQHQGSDEFALDFSVWIRHSASAADVEDASLWWTAPLDRVVRLATLVIPRQSLAQDEQFDCERMMFSPWNCVPEHRPIGSINRMRLAVYLASLQVRKKLNMVTR
jgi:Catalase